MLRFVFFGALLTALSFALKKRESFSYFLRTTQIMGLLYLFVAVWIMSIFGNYGDMASWQEVRQYELLS